MRVNNIEGLTLPNKKEEEFLKINFDSLFSYDFKKVENLQLDIMGLQKIEDNRKYDSILFDIVRNFDKNQSVLHIDKNIKEPIFLIHKVREDETFYTNSLKIEVKKGIEAQVIEVFVNSSKNSAININRNFDLEENSSLEYVKIQDIDTTNYILFNSFINQKKASNLDFSNFEYGDGFSVSTIINEINEEDVTYNINGLVKLSDEANCSTLIKNIHNKANSFSNINYKNTLKDSSKAVFKAKSIVNEKAVFSKAFQNCNTILLSDDATIFAQPHLEIYIDELEASHGTTTGTLNKEQLLYLQSRGIPKDKAYNILLEAFEKDIVENIKDELLKDFVKNYRKEKYV